MTSFTSLHSLSLSIFTPVHFISSTALTTSLFLTLDCLTLSKKSTPSMINSTFSVLLSLNYSGFTNNVLFSLSLSTSTFQSGLLLKLFAFPILLPRTCFCIKSNINRYRAHLACLLFNFCAFIKYSRFL